MYGQPWYSGYNYPGYAPSFGYNPYQSGYSRGSPFPSNGYDYEDDEDMQERARALAERRARRAQYLPDEDDDDFDDWEYRQMGPRQRAYLEALRQRQLEERRQQEEAVKERAKQQQLLERRRVEQEEMLKRRALERQERQRALERKQREEEEERQRLIMERKKQARLRREEEARRLATEEELKKQQRSRSRSRSQSSETAVPIHFQHSARPSSPSKVANGSVHSNETSTKPPRSPSPSSKPKHTLEEMNEAATRIQNQYRVYASSRTLDQLAAEFHALKNNFVYPRIIDFQKPGGEPGHITVGAYRPPSEFDNEREAPMAVDGPEGKLDYTSTNYPLHTYAEGLDKLLIKLDGVESWGKKQIRDKRRLVVKEIEKEASKLERYWKQTWVDYVARKASESKEDEQQSHPQPSSAGSNSSDSKMEVSEEPQAQSEPQSELQEEQRPRRIPISSPSPPNPDSKEADALMNADVAA